MQAPQFASEALRVNLQRTSAAWSLTDEESWLVALASDRYGIQQRALEFFRELHHPYPNSEELIEHLRTVMLADLPFWGSLPDSERALGMWLDAADRIRATELSQEARERAVLSLLELASELLRKHRSAGLRAVVARAAKIAQQETLRHEPLCVRASSFLKRYAEALGCDAEFQDGAERWLRTCLQRNVAFWREGFALHELQDVLAGPALAGLQDGSNALFERTERELAAAGSFQALVSVPDFEGFAEHARAAADKLSSVFDRSQYLLWLLRVPGMRHLSASLLSDLERGLGTLQSGVTEEVLTELVDSMFNGFQRLGQRGRAQVLDCILSLGRAVHRIGCDRVTAHFFDRTVRFGFVPPSVTGVNDQWQVMVDPNHLRNLRVWLRLIELDPARSGVLSSALIANLKLSGVFLSDTDLFQRDISRLLNADIEPAYTTILRLGRLLPVYFQEVGAEGELRDVTTRMDELSGRRDRLIHFLRKEVHAESNTTHVELAKRVLRYWYDGDARALEPMLPLDVRDWLQASGEWFEPVHRIVVHACGQLGVTLDALPEHPHEQVQAVLDRVPEVTELDRKRVTYLLRLVVLLRHKYGLEASGVVPALRSIAALSAIVTSPECDRLQELLDGQDPAATLQFVFSLMARLKAVIVSKEVTEPREEIYRKRHIAAGIPSMYGMYFEPKCAALGMIYRLESLATTLAAQVMEQAHPRYVSFQSLAQVARVLELLRDGLALAGMSSEGFDSHLKMLQFSLKTDSFSLNQFVNLFQFLADNVQELIQEYFLAYHDATLRVVLSQHLERTSGGLSEQEREYALHRGAEEFYRSLLSSSFPIGALDSFVTSVLAALNTALEQLPAQVAKQIMTFDLALLSSPVTTPTPELDNRVFLGAKGYFLKRMSSFGFPVPPGFILTTEVFRLREAIDSYAELREEVTAQIRKRIAELEAATGRRLGDPASPLLLSVRSGAAFSMHGAMDTFLNIGMNDTVVEGLSKQPNFGWTSWDCYRRCLQTWGMAHGIAREEFDRVLLRFKKKVGVTQKIQFTPPQMKEIAAAYMQVLLEHRVAFEPDPFRQVVSAVKYVLDSWDNDRARSIRRRLRIADDWGTAVVVQSMVLGNIGYDSGTGVVFTRDPSSSQTDVSLYGDFTTTSQGEDVVGGLVHPWPVSKRQRDASASEEGSITLETEFPEIYGRLLELARELVGERGFGHQEIEFTFESRHAQDLHLLQTRSHTCSRATHQAVFTGDLLEGQRVARGIGIGSGAMNGRVAFDMKDLARLSRDFPGTSRILVRPDTVPEDIDLLLECDGLLTARGGATSHAAVTAARLGKTCVVNCKALHVELDRARCTINGVTFEAGDLIALDGLRGNVYQGNHPVTMSAVLAL